MKTIKFLLPILVASNLVTIDGAALQDRSKRQEKEGTPIIRKASKSNQKQPKPAKSNEKQQRPAKTKENQLHVPCTII